MWKYILAIILGYFVLTKVVLQDSGEENLENQVINTDISIAQEVASTGIEEVVKVKEAKEPEIATVVEKTVNESGNIITEPKILSVVKKEVVKVLPIAEPTFRIADATEGSEDPTMDFSAGGGAGGIDVFAKLELALAGADSQEEVDEAINTVVSKTMTSMKKTGEVKTLISEARSKGLKTTTGEIKNILKETLVTHVAAKRAGVHATGTTDKYGNFLYTVKAGDTLWKIAQEYYASPFDFIKIYLANKDKIEDANIIEVGQVFRLPGAKIK